MNWGRPVTGFGVILLALLTGCGGGGEMSETGLVCSSCGEAIPFEAPYHSLTLSEEKRDPDGVSVLEARALVELCETCAAGKDLDNGMKVVSSDTGDPVSLDALQHVDSNGCWDCGAPLGENLYFSLVHYHEKMLPEMEVDVIDALDVLYMCPACRGKYAFERLELAPAPG
jgi:hypothetical protein